MHQVKLNDQLFEQAQRQAVEAGYVSVDEYIAELVSHDATATANFDHLFTPQRIAIISKASAEIDAGAALTAEQADRELSKRRDEWLRAHRNE